jgi:hypothetical protein
MRVQVARFCVPAQPAMATPVATPSPTAIGGLPAATRSAFGKCQGFVELGPGGVADLEPHHAAIGNGNSNCNCSCSGRAGGGGDSGAPNCDSRWRKSLTRG